MVRQWVAAASVSLAVTNRPIAAGVPATAACWKAAPCRLRTTAPAERGAGRIVDVVSPSARRARHVPDQRRCGSRVASDHTSASLGSPPECLLMSC